MVFSAIWQRSAAHVKFVATFSPPEYEEILTKTISISSQGKTFFELIDQKL